MNTRVGPVMGKEPAKLGKRRITYGFYMAVLWSGENGWGVVSSDNSAVCNSYTQRQNPQQIRTPYIFLQSCLLLQTGLEAALGVGCRGGFVT